MAGSSLAANGGLGRGRNEGVFRLTGACGLGHVRRWHFLKFRLKAMLFACCGFCSAARHQLGTVQVSADSQKMFVAKIPHF